MKLIEEDTAECRACIAAPLIKKVTKHAYREKKIVLKRQKKKLN